MVAKRGTKSPGGKSKKAKSAKANVSNVKDLEDAGCLTPEALSPAALDAINKLKTEDVQALKRVNEAIPLSMFFKSRAPQEG